MLWALTAERKQRETQVPGYLLPVVGKTLRWGKSGVSTPCRPPAPPPDHPPQLCITDCTHYIGLLSAKKTTMRASPNYKIEQPDVVTAFLGGKVDKEIYIMPPEGILSGPHLARLIKALYGLKQSPRCWNITLNGFIIEGLGFTCSQFDPCVYFREDGTFILTYVDDLLIIGCYVAVQTIKHWLVERFDVVALGGIKHFLGMVVTRNRERCTITLGQSVYVDRRLGRFVMVGCHGVSTTLDPKVKILPFDSAREQEFDSREYRSAIGGLRWFADATRPNIAFATGLWG